MEVQRSSLPDPWNWKWWQPCRDSRSPLSLGRDVQSASPPAWVHPFLLRQHHWHCQHWRFQLQLCLGQQGGATEWCCAIPLQVWHESGELHWHQGGGGQLYQDQVRRRRDVSVSKSLAQMLWQCYLWGPWHSNRFQQHILHHHYNYHNNAKTLGYIWRPVQHKCQ